MIVNNQRNKNSPFQIMDGANPFFYKKGKIGCLLCHGFTGTPNELLGIGIYLANQGITTIGPRLPGHGTSIEDMKKTSAQDWFLEYTKAYTLLTQQCKIVFIAGLSMGGVLTLKFATEHKVQGIITIATPVTFKFPENILLPITTPLLKNKSIKKSNKELEEHKKYQNIAYNMYPIAPANSLRKIILDVRKKLDKITAPILIIQGKNDAGWIRNSAKKIYEKVSSKDKEIVFLEHSSHCLTLGPEKEKVKDLIYNFIVTKSKL